MGEGSAAVVGGLIGGVVGASAGYQAGYNQRDSELQPYINQLRMQLQAKDQRIAELESQLKARIPVISDLRRKLGGSQS